MVPGSPAVHYLCAALRSKSGAPKSFFAAARRVRCAQGGRAHLYTRAVLLGKASSHCGDVCAARDLVSDVQDDHRPGTGHQVDCTIVRTMTQVRIWQVVQYPRQTVLAHAVWMMSCSVRWTTFLTPGYAWSGRGISPQTSMQDRHNCQQSLGMDNDWLDHGSLQPRHQ